MLVANETINEDYADLWCPSPWTGLLPVPHVVIEAMSFSWGLVSDGEVL